MSRPEMKCRVWEEKDDLVVKWFPSQCMLGEPVQHPQKYDH